MYLRGITAYGLGIAQAANQGALQALVGLASWVISNIIGVTSAANFRTAIGAGVGYTQIALKTASFTAADGGAYDVDSSAGPDTAVVCTAPACAAGVSFRVKWTVGDVVLTVVRAGADTIDGSATFPAFPAVKSFFTFTGDQTGTNWRVE